MILLFNVFVTPAPLKHAYNRSGFSSYDNFDIFKYCLSSVAHIYNWSKIILQVKLDPCYAGRQNELASHIYKVFGGKPNFNYIIGSRNERQKDWVDTLNHLDDELIFYSCNHDHIFIDANPIYFNRCIETVRKYQNEPGMFAITHYPDYIPLIKSKPYKIDGPVFITNTPETASFSVITKALYKKWWTEVDFGDAYLPRSDWGEQLVGRNVSDLNFLVPSREIFRHFDGYHNLACPTQYHMEHFPPLNIPHNHKEGFDKIEKALKFYIGEGQPGYEYLHAENREHRSFGS